MATETFICPSCDLEYEGAPCTCDMEYPKDLAKLPDERGAVSSGAAIVSVPCELFEKMQLLLFSPKAMISSTNEVILDWDKRNEVLDELMKIKPLTLAKLAH